MADESLEAILNRDPIAEAETLFQGSFGGGKDRDMALLGWGMLVNQTKREALLERGDADFGCKLDRYVEIITDIGFRKVLDLPFTGRSPWKEEPEQKEHLYAYWLDRGGVLLVFDTYGDNTINGGNIYYNWIPNEKKPPVRVTSSGGWSAFPPPSVEYPKYEELYDRETYTERKDPEILARIEQFNREFNANKVWIGSDDCREAIRHKIAKLEEFGTLLNPWKGRPFLWFLNYMDTRDANGDDLPTNGYDYKAINEERIKMLPQDVQDAINVPER